MGKLIVIEGVDSSGKETQTNLLYEYYINRENRSRKYHFRIMTVIFVCR